MLPLITTLGGDKANLISDDAMDKLPIHLLSIYAPYTIPASTLHLPQPTDHSASYSEKKRRVLDVGGAQVARDGGGRQGAPVPLPVLIPYVSVCSHSCHGTRNPVSILLGLPDFQDVRDGVFYVE